MIKEFPLTYRDRKGPRRNPEKLRGNAWIEARREWQRILRKPEYRVLGDLTVGLIETVVYWNGIAMADSARSGEKCVPYPSMPQDARFGWGIYRLFDTADEGKVFVGITSNVHWDRFCGEFDFAEFHSDPRLATNLDRAEARTWFVPVLAERLKKYTASELEAKLLKKDVPCARPDELFAPLSAPDLRASAFGDFRVTAFPSRSSRRSRRLVAKRKRNVLHLLSIVALNTRRAPRRLRPVTGASTHAVRLQAARPCSACAIPRSDCSVPKDPLRGRTAHPTLAHLDST